MNLAADVVERHRVDLLVGERASARLPGARELGIRDETEPAGAAGRVEMTFERERPGVTDEREPGGHFR